MKPPKNPAKKDRQKPKMVSTKPIFEKLGIAPEDRLKYLRGFYHEMEEMKDEIELEAILAKPVLNAAEIWSIKAATFYAWRKKYDFPRILAHFSAKLNRFEEWKSEFEIDNEFLMYYGISNCINFKDHNDPDKLKYIFFKDGLTAADSFMSFLDLRNKVSLQWREPETFTFVKSFMGYLDWCNSKKIKADQKHSSNNLLKYSSSSNYNSPDVETSILDGLKLLKVGGIRIESEELESLNVKNFEFVNASYLHLNGQFYTRGSVLKFENSFVDYLICENLNINLLEFSNSSLNNLSVQSSKIGQWQFYKCNVTGKISNSELSLIHIMGGSFHPVLDNTFISDVHAFHINELNFVPTYQTLKKTYAAQGDDRKAIYYFLKEKELERLALYKSIFNQKTHFRFKVPKYKKWFSYVKSTLNLVYLYISSLLNNLFWGYGRKPFRIIGCSLVIILLCALIFHFNQELLNKPGKETAMTVFDSFYYSTVTFTTLGYGDFTPKGFLRVIAAFEALFGGMSIGFLVAGFSNLKY